MKRKNYKVRLFYEEGQYVAIFECGNQSVATQGNTPGQALEALAEGVEMTYVACAEFWMEEKGE